MSLSFNLAGPALVDIDFVNDVGLRATIATAFAAMVDCGDVTPFGVTIAIGEGITLQVSKHQAEQLASQLSALLYDYDLEQS